MDPFQLPLRIIHLSAENYTIKNTQIETTTYLTTRNLMRVFIFLRKKFLTPDRWARIE
jgi:hypothetical protein